MGCQALRRGYSKNHNTDMQTIHAQVQVSFPYAVHFTTNVFAPDNPVLCDTLTADGGPARVLFVVEQPVEDALSVTAQIDAYCRRCAARLQSVRNPLLLPGGEGVKNDPAHVQTVLEAVNAAGLDRHSFICAVGGGALLDAAGFAAAVAHRGIRLVRLPTTTLAQNDSGVGVKNAVNYFGKKNWVGTFAPPFAVINDFHFLATQPEDVWRGGIAEAVKVALIQDAAFFAFLEENAAALAARDMEAMQTLVYRCAERHVRHITTGGDPFEMGSSRPLDFGHWAAHKLEQMTQNALPHGDAVAIGLALDTTYSHVQGWLSGGDWRRVLRVLSAVGFPLCVPLLSDPALLDGLREFQEHLGGELTIQMLRGIGAGFNVHQIDAARMREAAGLLQQAHVPPLP